MAFGVFYALKLLLIPVIFVLQVESYEIIGDIYEEDGSQLQNPVKGGTNLILKCKANKSYERCKWRHKTNVCKFEWMRGALFKRGGIKKKSCSIPRINLQKEKYKNRECSIVLKNVQPSDDGEWLCQLKEYERRRLRRRRRRKGRPFNGDRGFITLNLNVETTSNPGIYNCCDVFTKTFLNLSVFVVRINLKIDLKIF